MEKKGMINIYTCEDGHRTVTGNLSDGVTPFMIGCRQPHCKKEAHSCFYRVPQDSKPEYVWCAGPVSKDEVGVLYLRKATPLDLETFGFYTRMA